jgi:hypothetical protein
MNANFKAVRIRIGGKFSVVWFVCGSSSGVTSNILCPMYVTKLKVTLDARIRTGGYAEITSHALGALGSTITLKVCAMVRSIFIFHSICLRASLSMAANTHLNVSSCRAALASTRISS